MGTRRDDQHKAAELAHAGRVELAKRMRDEMEANPGAYPLVEQHGFRVEALDHVRDMPGVTPGDHLDTVETAHRVLEEDARGEPGMRSDAALRAAEAITGRKRLRP